MDKESVEIETIFVGRVPNSVSTSGLTHSSFGIGLSSMYKWSKVFFPTERKEGFHSHSSSKKRSEAPLPTSRDRLT